MYYCGSVITVISGFFYFPALVFGEILIKSQTYGHTGLSTSDPGCTIKTVSCFFFTQFSFSWPLSGINTITMDCFCANQGIKQLC